MSSIGILTSFTVYHWIETVACWRQRARIKNWGFSSQDLASWFLYVSTDHVCTSCNYRFLEIYFNKYFYWSSVEQEGVCHAGTKASKVVFLGSSGRLLTTGFSRHSDRQYAIWSQHDLNVPLICETIDSSSGVVFPYYDNDTNMVYLAGKVTNYVEKLLYC